MTTEDGGTPRGTDLGPRGVPAIGDPGRAARELPAGPPPGTPAPPDHVLTEHSVGPLEIRAASVRGLMHRYRDQPRQDAFSVTHDPETATTIVVVCDGVGSLARSHEAASFVVERLPAHYREHHDWETAVKAVNGELVEFAAGVRTAGGPDADPGEHGMATTLVAVAIAGNGADRTATIVRSDDSTVWLLSTDGRWSTPDPVTDPDAALHTGAVRALPASAPRLAHYSTSLDSGALFVMTDGVGVPLETAPEVGDTLASWWATPPTIFEFGGQVGFARKSHMDDRTVVGVWVCVDVAR